MKRFLLITAFLLCCLIAGAQRTSRGMGEITLTAGSTLSHWGGELTYGQYLMSSYWFSGVAFHNRFEWDIPSGEKIHFPRLEARGGMLYRLLSSYNRAVSLYVGGDVFLGMEMLDLYGTLTEPVRRSLLNNGYKPYQFIYGTAPRVELELFLSPSFALVAGGRAPLTFGTRFPLLGWELSAGGRLNF